METKAKQTVKVIVMAVLIFAATILSLPLLGSLSGSVRMIASVAVYLVLVSIVLVQTKWIDKKGWDSLGFIKGRAGRQVLIGVLLSLVTCSLFVAVPLLLGFPKKSVLNANPGSFASFLTKAVFYMLIVGPVEEIIFRGYFFERLRALTGSGVAAVAVSSLLFGLWHFPNTGDFMTVLITALIGVVFSVARLKLRNCGTLSVAVAHGLHDTLILLLSWFLL